MVMASRTTVTTEEEEYIPDLLELDEDEDEADLCTCKYVNVQVIRQIDSH